MVNSYLLGIHDLVQAFIVYEKLTFRGYSAKRGSSSKELLELSKGDFTHCIMDVNYGKPNSLDFSVAKEIKKNFKGKLIVVSANPGIIEEAIKEGFDAREKMSFFTSLDDFLKD